VRKLFIGRCTVDASQSDEYLTFNKASLRLDCRMTVQSDGQESEAEGNGSELEVGWLVLFSESEVVVEVHIFRS
jgi:hypothetical protein